MRFRVRHITRNGRLIAAWRWASIHETGATLRIGGWLLIFSTPRDTTEGTS